MPSATFRTAQNSLSCLCHLIPYPAGRYASLAAFKHEVVGPFAMSELEQQQACRVSVSHDSALPEPQNKQQQQQGVSMSAPASSE